METPSDRVLSSWREHAIEDFLRGSGCFSMPQYTRERVYGRTFREAIRLVARAAEIPEEYWF